MTTNRVTFIDAMRGFSLFGILLANLVIFQFDFGWSEIKDLSALDNGASYFVKIFIEGSFMPIFTILFGYSLIKLIESIRKKKEKSLWSILRRATGLIALGLLHRLLWGGDILFAYGVMTILLIPFINRKPKTLFIWTGLLLLFSTVQSIGPTPNPMILQLCLFGMGLAKTQAFVNMENEKKWYLIGALLIPVGLACKSFSFIESTFSGMLMMNGSQLLAVGYVCLAALLYKTRPVQMLAPAFESVGKLSLTNYLMQTVICTAVFYEYGLGLSGKLGIFGGMLFGIVLYSLQCIFSIVYLKKFKRGPIENILRIWTNWSWNGQIKIKQKGSTLHE
ncbi:DUF418 domain-containing protein [Viridibacillus sp. YIM B01967]|uniref:DUF418 domain-containing protein n=1 Tax=Viridibacillus soli TaxID=2798301 RepID=A0ABS1H9D1_9BACL|nr:DUF418 domain-containing protein [Viridibacillus soli]MBK3496028.1 DUF418 domain-containing protein [Viridibacillus soli]